MTILIIGSGAREHAIAAALARSPQHPTLLAFGSAVNPGIKALCSAYTTGSLTQPAPIVAFAREHNATLAIIGPEAPLAAGVADALWAANIPTVGPTQSLARIESSKTFTRDLLAKHDIPGNPYYHRFESLSTQADLEALELIIRAYPHRHVIKDDGLAGGKGVKVCGDHLHTHADSLAFCRQLSALGHPFVIEEKLEGEEFSLLSFCDGHTLAHMPAVQDHKRAFNDDRGPNTGGMGSYTAADHALPFLTRDHIAQARRINEQVAHALAIECGAPYQGILYGGFMATADGVRLIEYNARFGDPEALNLLTLLETDFAAICQAITTQTLSEVSATFADQSSVCKYLVPNGYPDSPRIGDAVHLPASLPANVTLYLSAVDVKQDQLIATGSRTVAIVATATTLSDAEVLCEQIIEQIPGPFFHRTDIGTSTLIQRRIDHMQTLRP
ncbi:MAG: phosphoribosylamine--glycine ligase [Acidobacteriota bacterium]